MDASPSEESSDPCGPFSMLALGARAMIRLAPVFPQSGGSEPMEVFNDFLVECAARTRLVGAVGCGAGALVAGRSLCRRKPSGSPRPSAKPVLALALTLSALLVVTSSLCAYGALAVDAAIVDMGSALQRAAAAMLDAKASSEASFFASLPLSDLLRNAPAADGRGLRRVIFELQEAASVLEVVSRALAITLEDLLRVPRSVYDLSARGRLLVDVASSFVAAAGAASTCWVCAVRSRGEARRCRGASACARVAGLALMTPAVMIIVGFATAELALGFGGAAFCRDADANALVMVEVFGGNEFQYNVTRYYTTGEGFNPFLKDLSLAMDAVARARSHAEVPATLAKWRIYEPLGARVAVSRLGRAQAKLEEAMESLSRGSMCPHYRSVVHGTICHTLLGSVAWVAVLSIAMGVVCLPAMALAATSFFEARAARRAARLAESSAADVELSLAHHPD